MASAELLRLQNQLKKSPLSFEEEFKQQLRHFESSLQVYQIQSQESKNVKGAKEFATLINFMCHCVPFYKKTAGHVPGQLIELLAGNWENLEPHLRKTIVQGLIMLQNRQMCERLKVLPVFFTLFRAKDKQLRKLLFSHIVNDIKKINRNKQQNKLNSTLQAFITGMLKDDDTLAAKKSLDVMIELWRRKVWADDKTVLAISQGCFHKDTKIFATSLRFFLGMAFEDDEDDDEGTETGNDPKVSKAIKEVITTHHIMPFCRSKKKRQRELKRALHTIRSGKRNGKDKSSTLLSANAINLLYDPQQLVERLFSQLKKSSHPFELRLLQMNVISRIVGQHKLILFNFYPFLQRYIQPHQKDVTHILAYLAQATHNLVDPEVLSPCIKSLANNFVTDRSSTAVMAVGLNAIRELCLRCPLVMEQDLLLDLAQYKKSKQKGVMMAARALIALFRKLNPELLAKKDRGKSAALLMKDGGDDGEFEGQMEYGQDVVSTDVLGADLLAQLDAEEAEQGIVRDPDEEWNVEEDDDSDADFDWGSDSDEEGFEDEDEDEDEDKDDGEDGFLGFDGSTENLAEGKEEEEGGEEPNKKKRKKMKDEGVKKKKRKNMEDGEEGAKKKRKKMEDGEGAKAGEVEEEKVAVVKKKVPYAGTRILTPKDFQRIKELRAKHKDDITSGKKRREEGATLLKEVRDEVDPEDIVGYRKKVRLTKEERMASIYEGREGRLGFGGPKERGGGSTNAEKMRSKNFQMVKNSRRVSKKKQGTMFDKAKKASNHIKSLKKHADNSKKKLRKRK